jgi:hypothetical protein
MVSLGLPISFEISSVDLPCEAISISLRCSAKLKTPFRVLFERLISPSAPAPPGGGWLHIPTLPRDQLSKQRRRPP